MKETRTCPICKKYTSIVDNKIESCTTCGANESFLVLNDKAGFVRTIREKTGIPDRDFAKMFSISEGSLKTYEKKNPSRKYLQEFQEFIEDYYNTD